MISSKSLLKKEGNSEFGINEEFEMTKILKKFARISGMKCPFRYEMNLKNSSKATMHCQRELEEDLWGKEWLDDETMSRWYWDSYSTSKHLFNLHSWVIGLKPKLVAEIGFGRSSFVLMRASHQVGGRFISVDKRDFSYLCSEAEKKSTKFLIGYSDLLWDYLQQTNQRFDFLFLDYFSNLFF